MSVLILRIYHNLIEIEIKNIFINIPKRWVNFL